MEYSKIVQESVAFVHKPSEVQLPQGGQQQTEFERNPKNLQRLTTVQALTGLDDYRVKAAKDTVKAERYSREPMNVMSDKKRKLSTHCVFSSLYGKTSNASAVKRHQKEWNDVEKVAEKKAGKELWSQLKGANEDAVADDLKNFSHMRGFKEVVGKFVYDMLYEPYQGIVACMDEFLKLSDEKLDLTTDRAFTNNLERLGKISHMADGITGLMDKYPEQLCKISAEKLNEVRLRLRSAQALSEYYYLRMDVISDPFYKKHLRSEFSDEYHRGDQVRKRNLAVKLLKLEGMSERWMYLNENIKLPKTRGEHVDSERYQEEIRRLRITERMKSYLVLENGMDHTEFDELSPHKEYLESCKQAFDDYTEVNKQLVALNRSYWKEGTRERLIINEKIDELEKRKDEVEYSREYQVYRRLSISKYYVSGHKGSSYGALFPNLTCLTRLKAAQLMRKDEMMDMLTNLSAREQSTGKGTYKVQPADEKNYEGLRQLKELYCRQAEYLFRKYGTGLETRAPDEFAQHKDDMEQDFTGMQGIVDAIQYMRNFPQVFNKKSKQDLHMENIMIYYHTFLRRGNRERLFFCKSHENEANYYRNTFQADASELAYARKAKPGMRSTVNWNCEIKDRVD